MKHLKGLFKEENAYLQLLHEREQWIEKAVLLPAILINLAILLYIALEVA